MRAAKPRVVTEESGEAAIRDAYRPNIPRAKRVSGEAAIVYDNHPSYAPRISAYAHRWSLLAALSSYSIVTLSLWQAEPYVDAASVDVLPYRSLDCLHPSPPALML